MTDHKQQQNVEYINYLGSILTNAAICTREIKSGVVMAVAASTNKNVFISKLDLILRKKVLKCNMRSVAGKVLELGRWSIVRVAGLSLQLGQYSSLTAPNLQHTANQERYDQCGNQQHSRELLVMGTIMPVTC